MRKMKHYVLLMVILLISLPVAAVIPDGISYQAVVRDASGTLATNKPIGVRISILRGSEDGSKVYSERHSVTSNSNGLVSLRIGTGNVEQGAFSSINWSDQSYFAKVEMDPEGGTSYSIINVTQLLAVPYAYHAKSADELKGKVNYNELLNLPAFKDSVELYGFSGSWNDLLDRPTIDEGFSGNYNDLLNLPVFKDSIAVYGFSKNYNDLLNLPVFKDSVAVYGFSGNYGDLSALPLFKDSVELYGFSGSWNDLTDRPNLQGGAFSGDYNDLANLPVFKDSVDFYGFNKNYNDLINQPSIPDSVAKYGFSGNYDDLNGKPQGTTDGDILYWEQGGWSILPIGLEGQVLAVANGKPAWLDPYFSNVEASTYKVGDIYYNNGVPEGIVIEVSSAGRYGKIISLYEQELVWDPLGTEEAAKDDYEGEMPLETNATDPQDGSENMSVIRRISEWQTKYPAFAHCYSLGDNWYLPARYELNLVFENKNIINEQLLSITGANVLDGNYYWSSTESSDIFSWGVAFKDYTIQIKEDNLNILAGDNYDSVKSGSYFVRPVRRLSWSETTSKPVEQDKLYAIGDIYYENEVPVGIVYSIENGGLSGKVISFIETQKKWSAESKLVSGIEDIIDDGMIIQQEVAALNNFSDYEAFVWCGDLGTDWYLPAIDELDYIYQVRDIINVYIKRADSSYLAIEEDRYWSSTQVDADYAQSMTFENIMNAENGTIDIVAGTIERNILKATECSVRAIRKF